MATRMEIDAAECVKLAKSGLKVRKIAERMGCRPPAVYRALRRGGYATSGMTRRGIGPEANYPPTPKGAYNCSGTARVDIDAEEAEIAARRIQPRDPCARCGVRGDIGCGCTKAPIGWRAG